MTEHPEYTRIRRRATIVGWSLIAFGIVGLVLPIIPGIVLIILGVSVLALHTQKAHESLARLRAEHPEAAQRLERIETHLIGLINLTMHSHEYVRIPVRHGTQLDALVETSKHPDGVAIILHSASDVMESETQNALAERLRATGATVVRFEPHHNMGANHENYTSLTATSLLEDLRAVVSWCQSQAWWTGKLILAGHSVGGLVAGLWAQEHPNEVAELLLLAPCISGDAYEDAYKERDPDGLATWERERIRPIRHPLSHEEYGLSYTFLEDMRGYNLMRHTDALTMPVHILVGTGDTIAPLQHARTFAEAVGDHAHIHPLDGVAHQPLTDAQLATLTRTLDNIT